MPSPFPGMDPYLEGSLWSSVHQQLTAEIARQLAPKILPKYLALTERRFVMSIPETDDAVELALAGTVDIIPDVAVAHTGAKANIQSSVAVAPAPLQMATVMPESIPVTSVEIRDTAGRRLVALIEVLSPANKRNPGLEEYLTRRQRILASPVHLIEIDLLRRGERVPMTTRLPDAPYFAFSSRAWNRPITDVWPITFDQPLPPIPIPLLKQDPEVTLDLQKALTSIYDQLGFRFAVDYSKPPEQPLPEQSKTWAQLIMKSAGY